MNLSSLFLIPLILSHATFYHDYYHLKKTASTETFNQYAMTAAHMSLPFNTIVSVRNIKNNNIVEVRINDRGAFNANNIDLSKAAFEKLCNCKAVDKKGGKLQVQIKIIKLGKN